MEGIETLVICIINLREGDCDHHLQGLDLFKDLGVAFSSNLSFKYHIAETSTKGPTDPEGGAISSKKSKTVDLSGMMS